MKVHTACILTCVMTVAAYGVSAVRNDPFVSANELLKIVQPSDLIEFDRDKYRHWAMSFGKDESGVFHVINIPAESKETKEVTITLEKLLDVAGQSHVRVNNQTLRAILMGCERRSPNDALCAAISDVGKTLPYNFLGTNCEYYCTKWMYGIGFSRQVRNVSCGLLGSGIEATIRTLAYGLVGVFTGAVLGGVGGAILGFTGAVTVLWRA